jgi:hypothetical protein
MRGVLAVVLAAGVVLSGSGADFAAAGPARSRCPQLTDARGDVAQPTQEDPTTSAEGHWEERSLDVISATVTADAHNVTTYLRVSGLAEPADPVHSIEWSVRLKPQTARSSEYVWTRAWRLTGGDRFAVERDWTGTGNWRVGPATHTDTHTELVDTTGKVDAKHGLIEVQIPLSQLATWDIPKTAPVWDVYATTRRVTAAAVGDANGRPMMWEYNLDDETRPTSFSGRLNQPGCSPPRG